MIGVLRPSPAPYVLRPTSFVLRPTLSVLASILSHPAVPLAVAVALGPSRVPAALTAVACVASVLPDVDAFGFAAGIPYGDPLGHRGFTHSIVFAALTAFPAPAARSRSARR